MRRYRQRKKRTGLKCIGFLLLLAMAGVAFNYLRPLPKAEASIVAVTSQVGSVKLAWPTQASAAIGAKGFGVLASRGSQSPRPMASLAKLVTALAVLEKHRIKPGQQGPTLTLSVADVALFEKYYAAGGAVVKVEAGEKITLYQALQAILLPSANNMADSMALWAFGSMDEYLTYANAMAKRLGLSKTILATDASGMSPDSTSTPSDLIRLGEFALRNPVIAEIVAQPSATIPIHGPISSANSRLGQNNIIGIKTGLTDQAGGCYLFAAKHTVDSKEVTIIGVIMGAPSLRAALLDSEPLLNSAKPHFKVATPIKAGETFATLATPWGATATVVARHDVTMVTWQGVPITPRVEIGRINGSLPADTQVGTALISSGSNTASTPLILKEPISGPTWQWRLKRF